MKILPFLLFIIAFTVVPLFPGELQLQTGLNGNIGWVYAAEFVPGFNGGGIDIGMRWEITNWFLFVRLTGQTAPIGTEVVLQTGAGLPIVKSPNWELSGILSAVWGLALFKPYPLFEIGMEMECVWDFYFSDGFGFYAEAGLRYLTCPEYSSRVSFYQTLETPIGVGLVFRWK